MENTPNVVRNNLPSIHLGLLDKVFLQVAPKYAMNRIKAKASVAFFQNQGYITPGSGKRSMRDWFPRNGSADVDTLTALVDSRAGSRDLYMNTPIATGVLRRLNTNVLGAGLTLQSRVDREFLGLSEQEADVWERNTEREFRLWANSRNCDATRSQNFSQLQQLVYFNKLLSGDVFVLLPFRRLKNFPYALTLQVIEGDQVSNPRNVESFISDKTRAGIEIDNFGAPIRYWFRTKHPGDPSIEQRWVPVSAFGRRSGRRNVLHIFTKERPGQRRGMPCLSPVIEKLKQLSRLDESELMASIVSSFFTVFITKNTGVTQPLAPSFVDNNSVRSEDNEQDKFNHELGPGAMFTLDDDEDIKTAAPNRPNDSFEPFFHAIVKEIGAALEVPFELLMLSFNSSYSASRAAILEGWKTFKRERASMVSDFCQPIYEEWLAEAVMRGRINAPGFFTDPIIKQAWGGSFWGGPGMGQIDPKKETEAAIKRIDGRLSNYETESQSLNGGDWDGMIDRLSRETNKLQEKDLNPKETNTNIQTQTQDRVQENEDRIQEVEEQNA